MKTPEIPFRIKAGHFTVVHICGHEQNFPSKRVVSKAVEKVRAPFLSEIEV